MRDLDSRLERGPLRVRSVWTPSSPEIVTRRILRRRRMLFALDAVAVCACAVLVFFLGQRALRVQPTVVATAPSASAPPASSHVFTDGSIAELASRDTELRVENDSLNRVVSRLRGGARFQVVPNPQRTFEVQAGDVRVRVLGTIFSVQQLPSGQTQVLVERGRVEVAWLGGATLLEAGQGGAFPPGPEPEIDEPPSTAEAIAPSAPTRSSATAKRSWRDYALNGDYGKAYDELNTSRTPVRDDAADLMLAADVARLSGHPEQALRPLRSVCQRHPKDRRAPVAAFTMGRVLLDDLGRAGEAASAFQKARTLWPEGPLAEDALARETDAWERAGRSDRAHPLAEQYLARYPQGRHAAAMRKLLSR